MHYAQEYIRCGKNCGKCPHGPYWYAYWRAGGKLKKKYIGKTFKPFTHQAEDDEAAKRWKAAEAPKEKKPHPHDAVFSRRTITERLCLEILGLTPGAQPPKIKAKYRDLMLANHPDHGGDRIMAQRIAAAYTYLKSCFLIK